MSFRPDVVPTDMTKITASISISLDGYIAGPNADTVPLGDGGMVLHDWFSETRMEHPVLKAAFDRLGAIIAGRRGFDEAVEAWGPDPVFACPFFVLTHRPQEPIIRGRTTYNFVSNFQEAVRLARAACPKARASHCTARRPFSRRWPRAYWTRSCCTSFHSRSAAGPRSSRPACSSCSSASAWSRTTASRT